MTLFDLVMTIVAEYDYSYVKPKCTSNPNEHSAALIFLHWKYLWNDITSHVISVMNLQSWIFTRSPQVW